MEVDKLNIKIITCIFMQFEENFDNATRYNFINAHLSGVFHFANVYLLHPSNGSFLVHLIFNTVVLESLEVQGKYCNDSRHVDSA